MKSKLEKLIERWVKAADKWSAHGKAVLDWESKNEFHGKASVFRLCAKELQEVLDEENRKED